MSEGRVSGEKSIETSVSPVTTSNGSQSPSYGCLGQGSELPGHPVAGSVARVSSQRPLPAFSFLPEAPVACH